MESLIEGTFLDVEILWGIAAWRLAAGLVLVLIGLLCQRIVRGVASTVFRRRKSERAWVEDVTAFMPRPLALCLQILLWFAVVFVLDLPREPLDFARLLTDGFTVALVVALIWVAFGALDVASGMASRAVSLTETRLDDQLVPLLRKALKGFVAVVMAVLAVDRLGYSVASLVASLGIGGLALALASKDTVANLFGSVVVFTDRPFHVGDHVEVGGIEGVIEEVGIRTTRIRRFDKAVATVQNQDFVHKTIVNHSLRTARRVQCTVRLSRRTTASKMKTFVSAVREALVDMPGLDSDSIVVYFTEMAEGSLNVSVRGFTRSPDFAPYMESQQQVLLTVLELVEKQGLEIAFPLRAE